MAIALKINAFGGMMPALDQRLLPDHAAASLNNGWIIDGRLRATPQPTVLRALVDPTATKVFRIPNNFTDTIHLADATWLEFDDPNTDVLRTNVVGDSYSRYYWASSSAQPMYNTLARIQAGNTAPNNPLLLGVPTPSIAPGVTTSGGVSTVTEARSYVYTWETLYGEEGPPSPPTVHTGKVDDTWALTMSAPATNDTNSVNRNLAYTNIYRTVTGSDGTTTYFFVAQIGCGETENGNEHTTTTLDGLADTTRIAVGYSVTGTNIPANTTVATIVNSSSVTINNAATATATGVALTFSPVYSDTIPDSTVTGNNQLLSTNWAAPPVDLQGWVSMPNGIFAGWRSNEVWFSEPYRPHAWPAQYAVTADFPIIGLGVVGQLLIICTEGMPYWGTGVNPSVFSLSKIESVEPCMSRGSIVSAPEGVYYASPNGLVMVNQGSVLNVTRHLITKDKWLSLVPVSTLRAVRLGVAYYAWGSGRTGVFQPTAFEPTAFDQSDLAGSLAGVIIDPTDQRIAMTLLSNTDPAYNTMRDVWTGEVFIIRDANVQWLDIGNADPTFETYTWTSKKFQTPNKRNLAALKIYFDTTDTLPALNPVPNTNLVQTLASDQWGLVSLYADGVLVWTREIRVSGELMRLPSGLKADFWQFIIQARVPISNLQAAETARELAVV